MSASVDASETATVGDAPGARVCAGCGAEATMACPSCVKLKQSEPAVCAGDFGVAYYCEQECFKKHWKDHKGSHKKWAARIEIATPDYAMPACFRGYGDWTGTLRPWARPSRDSTRERLRRMPPHIVRPDYSETGQPTSEQIEKRTKAIRVYSPKDVAGIRETCAIGREIIDAAGRAVREGVTTAELDRVTYEATVERGGYPSPLNYYDFPCSVCTSVNEVICHGIPDLRELQKGDVVNVDVSVYRGGYHADLNETYVVGAADEGAYHLVETAFMCLSAGADLVRPGTMYRDVGAAVEKVAKARGCSVVRTYCGHGIGELFHTAPNIPHYAKNKATGIMKPGHIFTIEPMINEGVWRDKTWPDQWTAVTADGKRSAQFEHTFLVTEDGCEILTMRDSEPKMLWDIAKQQR